MPKTQQIIHFWFTIFVFTIATGNGALSQTFKTEKHSFVVETLSTELENPWGMAFLPDGSLLITERPGRIRHLKNGLLSKPVKGLPTIGANGQGGLLDIAVSPDYAKNQMIFFSYSQPSKNGSTQGTALARARFVAQGTPHLENLEVIFSQNKKSSTWRHFGSRIVFRPDGTLFLTIGDRGNRPRAQDPFDHAGSILRLNPDGTVPKDNPYVNSEGGAPEIWSIGHRNPQGAALHPVTGQLWTVEHGARGGDEINTPEKTKNYGWPDISYGRHYSGAKIGLGTHKDGMQQPIHYWDPSIAPSGLLFYNSDKFNEWRGNVFVGSLKNQMLVRLEVAEKKILHEEHMLQDDFGRIRDVRQGPDGYIYLLTDEPDGQLLRLRPRP